MNTFSISMKNVFSCVATFAMITLIYPSYAADIQTFDPPPYVKTAQQTRLQGCKFAAQRCANLESNAILPCMAMASTLGKFTTNCNSIVTDDLYTSRYAACRNEGQGGLDEYCDVDNAIGAEFGETPFFGDVSLASTHGAHGCVDNAFVPTEAITAVTVTWGHTADKPDRPRVLDMKMRCSGNKSTPEFTGNPGRRVGPNELGGKYASHTDTLHCDPGQVVSGLYGYAYTTGGKEIAALGVHCTEIAPIGKPSTKSRLFGPSLTGLSVTPRSATCPVGYFVDSFEFGVGNQAASTYPKQGRFISYIVGSCARFSSL